MTETSKSRIVFQIEDGGDVSINAALGASVLQLMRENGIAIDTPCSGAGTCGKCRVRVLTGAVASGTSLHITPQDEAEGWRLACQSKVAGDAVIFVPSAASAFQTHMRIADLSDAREQAIFERLREELDKTGLPLQAGIRLIALNMDAPTLDDTMPDSERVIRAAAEALGGMTVRMEASVLTKLPDVLRENAFCVGCVVATEGETARILDLCAQDRAHPVYGLAVDIGTTSVSAVLVELETGEILAKASMGNGQIRYGADVITRIMEQGKSGGRDRLRRAVVDETLLPMIKGMYSSAHVSADNVYCACIAGNTVMEHLLLGVSADPLRTEPYIPAFFQLDPLPAGVLAPALHLSASVYLAPNIGSYVGGDITAGALATRIWDRDGLTLFIDLGTNGEIVVGNRDFLMACACSAGPAFEGGDISCGMRATLGAIERVAIDAETLEPACDVIGACAPAGLCGSGIIDCISELFRTRAIDARGKFIRENARICSDEHGIRRYVLFDGDALEGQREIALTEVDIDSFIRAKGAIFSGVQTLLNTLSLSCDDLEEILVAGGIGSGIDMRAAVRIGMLPDLPAERFSYVGNSSLAGAYAMLVSVPARQKLFEIARGITYVELSTASDYMAAFVAACFLPHTDAQLFPSFSEERV